MIYAYSLQSSPGTRTTDSLDWIHKIPRNSIVRNFLFQICSCNLIPPEKDKIIVAVIAFCKTN